MIYISPDKNFAPYLLRFFRSKASFHSTDLDGLQTGRFSGVPADRCTFFFLPDDYDAVTASLKKMFRRDNITAVNYLNFEGQIILESWASDCSRTSNDF